MFGSMSMALSFEDGDAVGLQRLISVAIWLIHHLKLNCAYCDEGIKIKIQINEF